VEENEAFEDEARRFCSTGVTRSRPRRAGRSTSGRGIALEESK